MTHLVLTEAGIKAFEMPEKPDFKKLKRDKNYGDYKFFTGYKDSYILKQHESEVASAIENGVLLEKSEQSKSIRIIKASNVMETIVLGRIEPNKPYPLPEGWEVVIEYFINDGDWLIVSEDLYNVYPKEKKKTVKLIKK
jgi:hypothetical protein